MATVLENSGTSSSGKVQPRMTVAIVAAVAIVLSGTLGWLLMDAPAVDDSMFVLATPAPQRGDNSYALLVSSSESIRASDLANPGRVEAHIPADYNERTRAASDQILALPAVVQLPERVAQLLSAPVFDPTDPVLDPARERVLLGARDIAALLRLRVQRDLFVGELQHAWDTTRQGLMFCQLLQERTLGWDELALAQSCRGSILRGLETGFVTKRWQLPQLAAIASLPLTRVSAQRWMRALAYEYRLFQLVIERHSAEISPAWRQVVYHPNRTKRALLAAFTPVAQHLRAGDLRGARAAIERAQIRAHDASDALRNGFGARQVATHLAGLDQPLADQLDAAALMSLVRVRAALERYRLDRGAWPNDLAQLQGAYIAQLPDDPWSDGDALRYVTQPRKVYSRGADGRDDGGAFSNDFAATRQTKDIGFALAD